MLNLSPADIVANKMNDGNGTNGMSEPKKLIRAKPTYPTSSANGKITDKSNRVWNAQMIIKPLFIGAWIYRNYIRSHRVL